MMTVLIRIVLGLIMVLISNIELGPMLEDADFIDESRK